MPFDNGDLSLRRDMHQDDIVKGLFLNMFPLYVIHRWGNEWMCIISKLVIVRFDRLCLRWSLVGRWADCHGLVLPTAVPRARMRPPRPARALVSKHNPHWLELLLCKMGRSMFDLHNCELYLKRRFFKKILIFQGYNFWIWPVDMFNICHWTLNKPVD